MKKSVGVLSVFLVVLIGVSWFSFISNMISENKQYNEYLDQAEGYADDGLYQKAIEAYAKALAIKEVVGVRKSWLDVNVRAYQDGVLTGGNVVTAFETACQLHPKNVDFREQLLQFCVDSSNYNKAYDAYQDCVKNNVNSKEITRLGNQILYSYKETRATYEQYSRSTNGYYTVYYDGAWGVINPACDRVMECEYDFISPPNSSYVALYVNEKGARVINGDNVVEHILPQAVTHTLAYGNGLLPVCIEPGIWRYYDCYKNEYVFGQYVAASSFVNGIAAVCEKESWRLIDGKDNEVGSNTFSNVKLHSNGAYVYDDIMIASKDGVYGIYNAKGKSVSKFSCSDMDVYLGEYIAFQDADGKWGYVNSEGKVVIKAQYENAKSFSRGLGAVCQNGKWGYINSNNALVIDCQFVDADYFTSEGAVLVSSTEGNYHVLKLRFN